MKQFLVTLFVLILLILVHSTSADDTRIQRVVRQANGENDHSEAAQLRHHKKKHRHRKRQEVKKKKHDEISAVFEYILGHSAECGDPFSDDAHWIPAHNQCTIQCDHKANICLVDVTGKRNKCDPLPQPCKDGISNSVQH